jgi:hypothetical protein
MVAQAMRLTRSTPAKMDMHQVAREPAAAVVLINLDSNRFT